MADIVNHPGHYESGKFECIDVMEETQGTDAVLNFCICNAFKYLYRHNRKNGIEDIKKAKWYIDKYVEIIEKEVEDDGWVNSENAERIAHEHDNCPYCGAKMDGKGEK